MPFECSAKGTWGGVSNAEGNGVDGDAFGEELFGFGDTALETPVLECGAGVVDEGAFDGAWRGVNKFG